MISEKKLNLQISKQIKAGRIDFHAMIGKEAIWDCSSSPGFNHLFDIRCEILSVTKHRVKIKLTHYIPSNGHYIRYVKKENLRFES